MLRSMRATATSSAALELFAAARKSVVVHLRVLAVIISRLHSTCSTTGLLLSSINSLRAGVGVHVLCIYVPPQPAAPQHI
jgi:hypothetical protein